MGKFTILPPAAGGNDSPRTPSRGGAASAGGAASPEVLWQKSRVAMATHPTRHGLADREIPVAAQVSDPEPLRGL